MCPTALSWFLSAAPLDASTTHGRLDHDFVPRNVGLEWIYLLLVLMGSNTAQKLPPPKLTVQYLYCSSYQGTRNGSLHLIVVQKTQAGGGGRERAGRHTTRYQVLVLP